MSEAFSSLLEAAAQPAGLAQGLRAIEQGALAPLQGRGRKAASRHAYALIERLMQGDDPELARLLLSSGALGEALGGQERAREILAEQAGARGAVPIQQLLAPPPPFELPDAVFYLGYSVLSAVLVVGQLLLLEQVAPEWLDLGFARYPQGLSVSCLLLSMAQAACLCGAALSWLDRGR